jgi:hypothetical protein
VEEKLIFTWETPPTPCYNKSVSYLWIFSCFSFVRSNEGSQRGWLNINQFFQKGVTNLEPMESSIKEARGRFARPSETPYQKLIDHHKFYDLEDSQDFYDFDVKASGIMTECCGLTISKDDSSLFDKRESCKNALNPICKGRTLPPCRFMPAVDRGPL